MSKQMLDTLVQAGENEFTEFRGTFNADDVLRAIIGLANGPSTGYLVLGVELTKEDSKVVISGVRGAEAVAQQLRRLCEEQCVPPLTPTAELIGDPPGTVIVLEVQGKVDEQPYHPRDREITWIRTSGETRIVRLTEEAPALIAERRKAWHYELEYRASSAILRRVRFGHFRSLFDAELDLKPLNIIIGPNASGKSNLFKGLAFLRDIVVEKEWKRYEAAGRHLFWYGAQPDRLSIEISAELPEQRGSFPPTYALALRLEGERLAIVSEILTLKLNPTDPTTTKCIERSGPQARLRTEGIASAQSMRTMPPQTAVLRELGSETDFAPVAGLYRFIEGWRLLSINSQAARASTRHLDRLMPLAEDGSNLSAVLYALSQQKPADLFEEIKDRLGRAIGFPSKPRTTGQPISNGRSGKVSSHFVNMRSLISWNRSQPRACPMVPSACWRFLLRLSAIRLPHSSVWKNRITACTRTSCCA